MKVHLVRRANAITALFFGAVLLGLGQEQKPSEPTATPPPASQVQPSQPIPRLKVTTRLVTLQILARDGKGPKIHHNNLLPSIMAKIEANVAWSTR